MNNEEKLAELRSLQSRIDGIREELSISPPGKVLYQAWRNAAGDDLAVVEADGFGGATFSIVEGNYPIDYCTKFEKSFATEQEAEGAVEQLATERASPLVILGPPV